jgi:DNA-binding MarR family transcriptional regulator
MTVTAQGSAEAQEADHASGVGPDARRAWRAVQEIQLHGDGQNRLARVCEQHDLAPSSVKALLRLSGTRPTAMRELAAAFACDASYITAVVDALEERGLARREAHPTDRRVRTVVLTEAGLRVGASVLELLSEPPPSIAVLSPEEQRQLADLLDRVAAADQKLAERRAAG